MAQVNFYNLQQDSEQARAVFACRLAEKASSLGHSVCLLTENETAAQAIDSLLWSFAPRSFVPHALLVGTERCAERVSIAVATVPEWARDVLINLCPTAVEGFEPVARVNEIIIQEPSALQQARERFRHYQQAGTRPEMIAL